MKKIGYGLALLATTAWVGGMWAIGYLAAPVLFQNLPDRQMAGMLAGKLFAANATLGIVCAIYLLGYFLAQRGAQAFKLKVVWVVASMLLLIVIVHFAIQPIMAGLKMQALPVEVMKSSFASQFRTWHGVASILYLVQSLLGILLIGKMYCPETARDVLGTPRDVPRELK